MASLMVPCILVKVAKRRAGDLLEKAKDMVGDFLNKPRFFSQISNSPGI